MTNQPVWKRVAQLGDRDPRQHGGYWVFVDETGVYPPEAELLVIDEDEAGTAYRFILEPCTFINGILSDNQFHPELPAWFADKIDAVASTNGLKTEDLIAFFCSNEPISRALAWKAVADHYGAFEMDQYPRRFTPSEIEEHYDDYPYEYDAPMTPKQVTKKLMKARKATEDIT